jgi:protein gp37
MSTTTNISWTDSTWNPLYGCSRVSEGCRNCYAEQVVATLPRKFEGKNPKAFAFFSGLTKETTSGPRWTGVVKVHEGHLIEPLGWQKPRRVFVNSLSDLFHENVSDETIERIFAVMALAHWHTFQVLTKRPARMQALLSDPSFWDRLQMGASFQNANHKHERNPRLGKQHPGISWPLKNVWLGVSVEGQKAANERIPLLQQTPAAVRFLSCEPLLGPVDLQRFMSEPVLSHCPEVEEFGDSACEGCPGPSPECPGVYVQRGGVDWVIVGGESGPGFRPMDYAWAQNIWDQCKAASVPFFYKQNANKKAGQLSYPVERYEQFGCRQFPGNLAPKAGQQ